MLFLETLVVLRAGQNLYITSLVKEIYQKTVSEPVEVKGIGLHTGLNSEIKILPSLANTGIIFKRIDLTKNNLIKASYHNVPSARLCTTLENSFGVKVSTVEHLLGAFYIKGIDNALIEINNEEVPIMDGSAKNFLDVLNNTKIKVLSEKRNFLKMKMMDNRSAPQSVSSQAKISMNAAHEAGNSAVVKTQAQDYSSESFFERKKRFSTERRSLGMKLASKFA